MDMLHCFFTFIVYSISVLSIGNCQIVVYPKNEAVLSGQDSNAFVVTYNEAVASLFWSRLNGENDFIADLSQGSYFPDEYTSTSNGNTYSLSVLQANSADAVTFFVESPGPDSVAAHAELIVLGSEPVCGTDKNVSSVLEDTEVTYSCEVEYFGKWGPSMTWRDQNGQEVAKIDQSAGNKVRFVYARIVKSTDQDMAFGCRVDFTGPPDGTVPDDTPTSVYSRAAPSYVYTYTSEPLNVLYHVRNLVIENKKTAYNPGETVTCTAEGNPNPHVVWKDPNMNNETAVNGQDLIITTDMEGTNQLYCEATNTVEGTLHTVSEMLNFLVVIPTTTTTTPSPSTTTGISTTPSTLPSEDDGGGLSGGAIAGIVIAVLFVLVVLIVLYIYCCRKQPKDKTDGLGKNRNVDAVRQPQPVLGSPAGKPADIAFVSDQPPPYNPYAPSPKHQNLEGFMYADLALDDTPRSRKPIQVYENPELFFDNNGVAGV